MEITGESILNRLISVLDERGITQTSFYDKIGIAKQASARWRNGSLPSTESLIAIAKELNISLDWLITGDVDNDFVEETDCKNIVNRIDEQLELLTGYKKSDNIKGFYARIEDIVNVYEIDDWYNGRLKIDINKLCLIADKIGVSVQYLVTGKSISEKEYDSYNGDKSRLDEDFYKSVYCLNEDNEKFIHRLIDLCIDEQEHENK